MKTIIAPTDFSKAATSAIDYAAGLAHKTHSTLILLHACHPPVILSEAPVVIPAPEELEKDGLKRLNRTKTSLMQKHGTRLKVELICRTGFAADLILDCATERKADLIVMGTHGAGFIEEKLIGSITSTLIRKSQVPVLSIPQTAKFKGIKKIVLAADYKELKEQALKQIREVAGLYESHIYILNVTARKSSLPSVTQAVEGIKLEHRLEGLEHSFHEVVNEHVADGISAFAEDMQADMIVMIPRKHSIFKEGESKKMAFHTSRPLLTIHE
jgi:nucleotide-binding universal stress UspA family protein